MRARLLSVVEVCAVFALATAAYRLVQSTLWAAQVNTTAGDRPVTGYTILLALALLLYLLHSRASGTFSPFHHLTFQLKMAGYGFLPVFVLSSLLTWINWRHWPGAVLISIIEIGLLLWFAVWVREKPTPQIVGSAGMLLVPLALSFAGRVGEVLASILFYYLLVAASEELLFRGYMQARLNAAFGRPRLFFGIPMGWGWIITSLLFGLWHLGLGSGSLNGPHALWTVFAGLIFGLVREKSGGVTAPALLHGVLNYGPQAVIFHLFM